MKTDGRRLRIAVLNRVFSPSAGGAERYSMALVEQLAQRHEIHVFAQKIEHQGAGVTYHRVSSPFAKPRWLNQLWYAAATWRATRDGFDLVHSHENTWHGQVQSVHVVPVKYNLLHGRSGGRLLLRWLKVLGSPRLLAYLWLERRRFSVADGRCIVVASGNLMKQMVASYPATAASLRLLTPGVARVVGPASSVQQLAARQRLGLPEAGFGILFVANDYKKKGLDTLLQALQKLPPGSWVAVVGKSGQIPEYSALASALGVADRVTFLGPLKDVADAYVAADCLVHPTLEDAFAMVVLEAMAHGLPVVVSNQRYCGISSLLADCGNALLLEDPHDTSALAASIGRLLEDPALRGRLGQAAAHFAKSYLWSEIARMQEQIYFSVLESGDLNQV